MVMNFLKHPGKIASADIGIQTILSTNSQENLNSKFPVQCLFPSRFNHWQGCSLILCCTGWTSYTSTLRKCNWIQIHNKGIWNICSWFSLCIVYLFLFVICWASLNKANAWFFLLTCRNFSKLGSANVKRHPLRFLWSSLQDNVPNILHEVQDHSLLTLTSSRVLRAVCFLIYYILLESKLIHDLY